MSIVNIPNFSLLPCLKFPGDGWLSEPILLILNLPELQDSAVRAYMPLNILEKHQESNIKKTMTNGVYNIQYIVSLAETFLKLDKNEQKSTDNKEQNSKF